MRTTLETPGTNGNGVGADPLVDPLARFDLRVRVTREAVSDDGLVPCGTGDGCGATCANSPAAEAVPSCLGVL